MKAQDALEQSFHNAFSYVKKLPWVNALIKTNTWKIFRFKVTWLLTPRRDCHFTSFLRLPTQFEALCGPVLEFLLNTGVQMTLKITVLGCSNGAEAYSIASILRNRFPNLRFAIYAYDIDKDCIEKARRARYTHQEIFNTQFMTSDFVNATFDKENEFYVVKDNIRKFVHFDIADALSPDLQDRLGTSDIVYAQHMLIHLKHRNAVKAFNNIYHLLNPKAVLFMAGIEHGMRIKLTRKKHLTPFEYKVKEIHEEVGAYGKGWPWVYWGCEPFMTVRKDWQRRYSTIFLKS